MVNLVFLKKEVDFCQGIYGVKESHYAIYIDI